MKYFTPLAILAVLAGFSTALPPGLQAAPPPSPAPTNAPAPAPAVAKATPPVKIYATPALAVAPIPAADLASIKAAVPAKATVEPKKPRKVLLFWRAEGFVHPSIPYGVEALKQLGDTTGAYTSVSSDDMAMFDPGTLQQFDGVAFISTTQLKFENPVQRKALLDFVASGKGVVGIHAASDNFPTWPEGRELMGGVFHSHPWHAGDLEAMKLDDPDHPVNKGFNKQGFRLQEEIYQIVGPYGRDKQRELVSLDMSKPENQRTGDKNGKPLLVRTDNDFPISWIKKEGSGRVFYTSLGHNRDIYFVPQILQHYLDGIQYALGDLAADDLPTSALKSQPTPALAPEGTRETLQKVKVAPTPPKPDSAPVAPVAPVTNPTPTAPASPASAVSTNSPTPDQLNASTKDSLKDLPKYNYGDSTESLFNVLEALRKGTPETRTQFGTKFVALLQDPSATVAAKETVCRWLGWMGGEDAVPVLVQIAKTNPKDAKNGTAPAGRTLKEAKEMIYGWLGWMGEEDAVPAKEEKPAAKEPKNPPGSIGGYAIRALATIPVKSADQALIDLLTFGNNDRRLAVMSAIGIRGTVAAIPKLTKIAAMKSPALSGAALETLASFRTTDALNAILNADVTEGNARLKDAAVINASAGLLQNKVSKESKGSILPGAATEKLSAIAGSDAPYAQRLSAVRVLLSAHLPAGEVQAVALLKCGDYRLRLGAAESLAELATPGQLDAVSWNATPDAWQVVLKQIARKADPAYLPVCQKALGSQDAPVRLAAIAGISSCGDIRNLETLTPLLTDSNAPVAQAAKSAVAGLKGSDVSARLIELEGSSAPGLAALLLSTLADRQEHKAFDAAIAATASTDPALQTAGYEALSRLTSSGDLVKCLALVSTVKERNAENFQKALVRAALFDSSPSSAATQIAAAFDQGDLPQKEILINVLARLEVKESREKLDTVFLSTDVDLRKQGIRALSSARNSTSLALLPVIAETGQSNSEKILALKGYIDTIAFLPDVDLGFNARIKAYVTAWKLATRDEEKAAIRSAVKKLPPWKIQESKEAQQLLQAIDAPAPKTIDAGGAQSNSAKP